MHYVGRRASETNPLRSIPLLRPAHQVLGYDPLTLARMMLAQAERAVPNREGQFASACRRLGVANRCRYPGLRRQKQSDAMRDVNAFRRCLRQARRDLIAARADVERLESQPELPLAPALPAIDPDLLPSFPRILRLANANHPAGTIGNLDRAKGWGWHVTIERPNKAGGTVASFATRIEARDWLDAELAPLVMQ